MQTLRAFFHARRRLAILLLAAALAMKVLVPAGYMPGQQSRVLTIEICADTMGAKITRQIVVPHAGKPGEAQTASAKGSGVCAFSSLAMASLSGADPALLALALAFIIALGFTHAAQVQLRRVAYLRPPLRGPPARA